MVNLDNLFNLLDERDIKASKLSIETGISTGNISDWKKGRSMPTATKLVQLADYLDCSIDFLLGRTNKLNTNNVGIFNNQLTEQERKLLTAYRQNPNMQEAVNRLLRTETNITRAVRIARSNTSSVEVVYDDFSDLDNAPETDEDL